MIMLIVKHRVAIGLVLLSCAIVQFCREVYPSDLLHILSGSSTGIIFFLSMYILGGKK
jgi:hypothetical protein